MVGSYADRHGRGISCSRHADAISQEALELQYLAQVQARLSSVDTMLIMYKTTPWYQLRQALSDSGAGCARIAWQAPPH